MKNKYFPAFTLLELIVVIAISTIIIGMAYMAYELIYKDFIDYKNSNKTALVTLDFITILERDIHQTDSLNIDIYNLQLFQKNYTLQYEFYPEYTLRYLSKNQLIIDTFNIKIINFETENNTLFLEYMETCLDCFESSETQLIGFDILHINNLEQ